MSQATITSGDVSYISGEAIERLIRRIKEYEEEEDDGSANIIRLVCDQAEWMERNASLLASAPALLAALQAIVSESGIATDPLASLVIVNQTARRALDEAVSS